MLNVSLATTNNLVWDINTCDLHKGIDNLKDTQSTACTKIKHLNLLLCLTSEHTLYGFYVGLCQIYHIDIITDARAIWCVIIITIHLKLLTDPRCRLGYKWQQVVGHAIRQLTNHCRWVSTNRIEIAQDSSMEQLICIRFITNNLLVDLLGIAIRRQCHLDWGSLIYRQMLGRWLSVNSARTGEHDIMHIVCFHLFQERNKRHQIVTIVHQWLFYRLTNRLTCCKMNHSLNISIAIHYVTHCRSIIAVNLLKSRLFANNRSNTIQHIFVGIAQVVYNDYIISLLHQFDNCMRANVASTSCY